MKRLELVTDIGRIVQNARTIRELLPNHPALLCVVKADAYGHGAIATARSLQNSGLADAFAVATPSEGEALVKNGIVKPIVVLGLMSEEADADVSVNNGLHQAIDSPEDALLLSEAASRASKTAYVHIKLDTGMRRIGVSNDMELRALLKTLKTLKNVFVSGLFTHFCAADEDEDFTLCQLDRFQKMRQIVLDAGFHPVCHAAASTAMLRGDASFDMVRAGIALYGTGVAALRGIVQPAQTLKSCIVSLRRIQKGETVGYSRTFTARRDSVIATIPCGYGDGYPRLLSNRAEVLIGGKRAPIVGNVCMDMLMADVTDIPAAKHDPVVLLGRMGEEIITPDELARLANTIPYEIMLGFTGRVTRKSVNTQED